MLALEILCVFVVILGVAVPRALADGPLAARLASIVASSKPRSGNAGVAVYDLKARRTVFEHRADALVALASNTKLFTTAAALAELGPGYEFKTQIIASGDIAGQALVGDLVLRGGGDPNISGRFNNGDRLAAPRAWAAAVRDAGIARVTGDLVADDTFFDRQTIAPDWPKDQLLWWYCAPVSALSFNDNCVDVVVRGGKRAGTDPVVQVSPDIPDIRIVSSARTVGPKSAAALHFRRIENALSFQVTGSIRTGSARAESLTVADPAMYLLAAFARELREQGVQIDGKLRLVSDQEPKRRRQVIHVWKSRLDDSVQVANKRSQNFYAEQILKTLGAEKSGAGTFAGGIRCVAGFLQRIGIAPGRVVLHDGSGLSAGNRGQASAVVELLGWMAQSEHAEAFRDSLAVSGTDGTLRHRLDNAACRGCIAAKTGTINRVSTLSGYIRTPDGRDYAFSILCDQLGGGTVSQARTFQDAICRAIIQGN